MKRNLLLIVFAFFSFVLNAQNNKFWNSYQNDRSKIETNKSVNRITFPKEFDLYTLNLTALKQELFTVVNSTSKKSAIISLPNTRGEMELFEMYEASNFVPELQAQFPEIRAFSGKSLTDKSSLLKLSISPQGISSTVFRANRENEFIESYSQDNVIYAVYSSKRDKAKLPWTCTTEDQEFLEKTSSKFDSSVTSRLSDATLRTMRLAQSCTAEYANYFGATSAAQVGLVMAAFNATMTRCNGVYEKDLALHLNLIANTTSVIYYNPATDPYSAAAQMGNWNGELQATLTSVIGEANYDIGHLFGATGGGGNAGCIGCICVDGQKGSGITSPADGIPMGDTFDIDYVAHELGHQFGANHTFSNSNEGYGVNKEVGGGVTIMGYAGITSYNTHMNSIDIFHSASIAQVQANMVGKTCPTSTPITHSAPVVNAGADYTIPLSTPFILTGSATDAGGGSLNYAWEQNDDGGANTDAASVASPTKTTGPNFACYPASANSFRYFPTFSSILNGSTTTAGAGVTMEALSSVARTLNFRLTVRDNVVGQGQTNFDDVVVTVANKTALTVTMAAGTSYPVGSTQTVVWTGATGANGHSTIAGGANVDILFSSDNGVTWTTLLSGTPNDGTQSVTLPAGVAAPYCRFMVKASANIFFNISQPFSVGYTITNVCNTFSNNTPLSVPDGLGNNISGGTVTKTVNVSGIVDSITDVNVTLSSNHTYFWDMEISLIHPDGTSMKLSNHLCNGLASGFNINFDDSGAPIVCSGNPVTGTYSPSTPLSVFNGKSANGVWTLSAFDWWAGDSGSLNNFSIQICTQVVTLTSESFGLDNFTLYPNPNNGSFNIQFNSNTGNEIKVNVHDVRGREIFAKSYNNNGLFNESLELNNVQSGVYLVTVQDGARKEVKKIVVQ